jgi:voltage-gated potassium channel
MSGPVNEPRAPRISGREVAAVGALALIAREVLAEGPDQGIAETYAGLKERFRDLVTRDPIDSLIATVMAGSAAFYLAEKDHNPKVQTPWDAFVFITTCLSVGYDDVFARTDAGKAIASAVMTFGPAMATRALDPPAPGHPEHKHAVALASQEAVVDKLDAILCELRAGREARAR